MLTFRRTLIVAVLLATRLVNWAVAHEDEHVDSRATGAIMTRLSPDGASVAFSYQGAIWRMSLESRVAQRITKGTNFDIDPTWSHDGNRIAFVSSQNFRNGVLAVVDAKNGEPVRLGQEVQVHGKAHFDKTDRRLLGYFQLPNSAPRLAWYEIATGELTDAYPNSKLPGNLNANLRPIIFALSHDEQSIALVTNADIPGEQWGNQGPQTDLWKIPLVGESREPQRIITWPARIHELCWSADDRSLVVSTERGGIHTDLWQIPLADPDRDCVKITHGQADELSPEVASNGQHLCYTDNRFGATMIVLQDMLRHEEQVVAPEQWDFGVPTGKLTLKLAGDSSAEELTARIAVQHQDGKFHAPPGSLYRLNGEQLHFYVHEETSFEVPAGEFRLTASRGPEYRVAQDAITVRPGDETAVTLTLERWTDQKAQGWISGESHIHANYGLGHWYNSPSTMWLQCAGEDLMVANFMVANSDGDGVFDREFFLGRIDPHSTEHTILYWNQEFRATLWGHMTLLNLKWLVTPIYTGFKHTTHPHDVPTNADIADHVHDQNGLVNYTHPAHNTQDPYAGAYTAKEMPVDVALGKIDSMDILGNQFANMAVWYRMLNCGLHLPASAGTDCFLNRIPSVLPGAVRVYVHCGQEFNYETWIENHRRGKTFVSLGPVMQFTVNDKEPGDTIELSEPASVTVKAVVESQYPIQSVEFVVNGKGESLLEAGAAGKERKLVIEKEIRLEQSCWVALRVNGEAPPAPSGLFAHSSPVYVTVANQPLRSPEDALYFIKWIQRLRDDLRKRNQLPAGRLQHVEEQLAEAIEFYAAQIDAK